MSTQTHLSVPAGMAANSIPARRGSFSRPALFLAALCLLLGLAGPAPASGAETAGQAKSQDASEPGGIPDIERLDELNQKLYGTVTAAGPYSKPVTESASAITILLRDDIQRYGYRSLSEVLRSAGGLYVTYDRNYAFLGARGFNQGDPNSRVLILVDGHRINQNISDGGRIDTSFPLDVDLIDRVEIVRGPGSVLFGNNAFFGVINVVTRKGSDIGGHYHSEVSGAAGTFDTYCGRFTYGTGKLFQLAAQPVEFLLSGSIYDSRGNSKLFFPEYNDPDNNFGIARHLDQDSLWSGFGKLAWRDFTLEGTWIEREKHNPTAPVGAAFNDPRTRTIDERSFVNLAYNHNVSEKLDVSARAYYDRFDWDGFVPYDRNPDVSQRQAGEWWGAETKLHWAVSDRYDVSFGAEYRDDFKQRIDLREVTPAATILAVDTDRQIYGVYLHNAFTVRPDKLALDAGVRYDHFSTFGDTVNPRVAAIYHPFKPSTIKAIYGTAFRAPNVRELVLEPGLDAETVTTYELVYEQRFNADLFSPVMLNSTVSLFYNQIDSLISYVPGVGLSNLKGAETKGLEVGLHGIWSQARLRLSYSYQETTDRITGALLSDSPRHLGKANLSVPIYHRESEKRARDSTEKIVRGVFASVEFQYVSERLTLKGGRAPGYGLVNFNLFTEDLFKGLEVSAGVYNLLDREYEDPASVFHRQDTLEQDGRTYRVKLTYRF